MNRVFSRSYSVVTGPETTMIWREKLGMTCTMLNHKYGWNAVFKEKTEDFRVYELNNAKQMAKITHQNLPTYQHSDEKINTISKVNNYGVQRFLDGFHNDNDKHNLESYLNQDDMEKLNEFIERCDMKT
eukprot:UN11704